MTSHTTVCNVCYVNTTSLRIITASFVAASAFVGMAPIAYASPSSSTVTVDGIDYPVCAEEDCSDQVGQIGVWQNDGRSFLILGEDVTIAIDPACKDICLGA